METVELEGYLGVVFRDKNLLVQALTHRSYLNENRRCTVPHNERLEFLGDAVLDFIVTEYLLKIFPNEQEGRLTELRAALVGSSMLSQIAEDLILTRFLCVSQGEKKGNERARRKICGNAVEAILGALYLDQGIAEVEKLVSRLFLRELMDVIRAGTKHAKTLIQELSQKHYKITPQYRTIEATGPDHAKVFRVAVCLGSNVLTTGSGPSKLEAETEAAKVGYAVLRFKLRSTEVLTEE